MAKYSGGKHVSGVGRLSVGDHSKRGGIPQSGLIPSPTRRRESWGKCDRMSNRVHLVVIYFSFVRDNRRIRGQYDRVMGPLAKRPDEDKSTEKVASAKVAD
jgi:hypothetical protein